MMRIRLNLMCASVALIAATAMAQTTVTTTTGGTSGTVPLFAGTATIENSAITQSGGNIGIGTTTPSDTLTVTGGLTANGLGTVVNLYPTDPPWGAALDIEETYSQTSPVSSFGVVYIGTTVTGTNQVYSDLYIESPSIGDDASVEYNAGIWIQDRYGRGSTWNAGLDIRDQGTGANDYAIRVEGGKSFFGGNVGIGTSTPSASLEVNGNVKLTSASGASITFADGTVQSTAYTGVTCGGDFAESVDVTEKRSLYEPGDVMVIDPKAPGKFLKSADPYSTLVSGIYSTKPGVVGRRQTTVKSSDEVPMAMIGIVPTKVTTENGPIHAGDLLVTSSTSGYAMKGSDRNRMLGAVLGKALGSLDSGTGVIEVLVTLQ